MVMRRYKTLSIPQILTAGVDADDLSLTVATTATFPEVPFSLTLARGTAQEEIVLCTSKDATHFIVTRGYDETIGVAHGIGTLVEHTSIALDYREAGVVRLTVAERDALAGVDLWEGRTIYNNDEHRLQVRRTSGWDSILPTGTILPYGGATAPEGFLLCNGFAYGRASYPALFAVIGETFGVGDGSTTFNVPDMRGRFPLGKASSGTGSVLGQPGGTLNHTHTGPSHSHTGPSHIHTMPTHLHVAPSHAHALNLPAGSTSTAASHAHNVGDTDAQGSHSHSAGSTGSPSSTNTMDAYDGGDSTSAASVSHTHDAPTTSSGGSHAHNVGDTDAQGAHLHTIDFGSFATTSAGVANTTAVDPGDTVAAGTGATGLSGTAVTGTENPPFMTINYIVRI